MFILHIALQGCVRASDTPYGLTADTGGHVKYLLELVAALDSEPGVSHQDIVVRRFEDPRLGHEYAARRETISPCATIVRIDGATRAYLPKEALHEELPALAESLAAHIRALPRPPDLIHAHYADAGALAGLMKAEFGIPFVFTAHSLGRVKAALGGRLDEALSKRIAMEEGAIARAARVIASSLDEAEHQYGLYEAAPQARIVVNPPGCALEDFAHQTGDTAAVAASAARFLRHPERPPIIALARPVERKNLTGLIKAYASDEGLREKANLVIFAGTREDIATHSCEARSVLCEMLHLIDKHDLYGSVAIPKHHHQRDVPAIYRYGAERGGVFANLALHEPFGLTLLEAAASGLPVVATDRGGPNDILARCRNGLLVDPHNHRAAARAIRRLIEDPAVWQEAARNGQRHRSAYSWSAHASRYLADIAPFVARDSAAHPLLGPDQGLLQAAARLGQRAAEAKLERGERIAPAATRFAADKIGLGAP